MGLRRLCAEQDPHIHTCAPQFILACAYLGAAWNPKFAFSGQAVNLEEQCAVAKVELLQVVEDGATDHR